MLTRIRFDNNITKLHLIAFFAALYFYLPIMTLYLQQRGLTLLQINSLTAIIIGTTFLAEVPTGMMADKIGRKKSIILALGLQWVGECIYIFAEGYALFAFVAVIAGVGFAFSSGCFEALLYDSLKQQGQAEKMSRVIGLNGAFANAAFVVGPAMGGFIATDLAVEKFVLLIILTAISVAVALLVSLFLQEPASQTTQNNPTAIQLFSEGLGLIRKNKVFQQLLWLTVLGSAFLEYLMSLYQPYFVQVGIPAIWFGLAYASGSLLGLVASKYAYLLETIFEPKYSLLLTTALPGLFYLLLGLIVHPVYSVILLVVGWGLMSLREPLLAQHRNEHISSENRATVLSLINMAKGFYVSLAGLLIGWLADQEVRYAFLFMGIIILVSAFAFRYDTQSEV